MDDIHAKALTILLLKPDESGPREIEEAKKHYFGCLECQGRVQFLGKLLQRGIDRALELQADDQLKLQLREANEQFVRTMEELGKKDKAAYRKRAGHEILSYEGGKLVLSIRRPGFRAGQSVLIRLTFPDEEALSFWDPPVLKQVVVVGEDGWATVPFGTVKAMAAAIGIDLRLEKGKIKYEVVAV